MCRFSLLFTEETRNFTVLTSSLAISVSVQFQRSSRGVLSRDIDKSNEIITLLDNGNIIQWLCTISLSAIALCLCYVQYLSMEKYGVCYLLLLKWFSSIQSNLRLISYWKSQLLSIFMPWRIYHYHHQRLFSTRQGDSRLTVWAHFNHEAHNSLQSCGFFFQQSGLKTTGLGSSGFPHPLNFHLAAIVFLRPSEEGNQIFRTTFSWLSWKSSSQDERGSGLLKKIHASIFQKN